MKNRGIYRTVGSGKVTQANMRLSGVDGGSTASGGAFVDFGYKYSSDFSAGVDGWTGASGTVTGNIDSIGGEDNWLSFTVNNVSGEHSARKSVQFVIGKRYNITIKYYIPSGQTAVAGFVVTNGGYADFGSSSYLKTQDTVSTYSINIVAVRSGDLRLYPITSGNSLTINDAGGDDVFYIKDVKVEEFPLTSYLGHLLKITDSAGKSIMGYIKAAGTGETLDTNIFSSYDFTSGWTPVNATINGSNQFTVTENNGNIYKSGLTTVPALYKILFSSSQTQGVSSLGGAFNTIFMDVITYNTAVYSTIRFYNTLKDAVVTINSVSVQQVLTPSSSGATIVSTKGGTTYNFAYRNTSFTYNAANYYVIIKEAK